MLFDAPTTVVITTMGVVVLAAIIVFGRGKLRAKFKVPGGTVEIDGSNPPKPAVVAEDVEAIDKIVAHDKTGTGVSIRRAKARKIDIQSVPLKQERRPKG